ncbi:FAD synthase [Colletotrichum tanaceti]|nr:FAD synthase [Colletotrichum tanaceti]
MTGLVLLIMLLACLARRYPSPSKSSQPNDSNGTTSFPDKFQAVYIVSKHPFAEVDDFVEATSSQYHLDVKRYLMSMKQGLGAYLEDRPNVKAIFVGTRRTDPHGEKLTHFDPTDSGWPDFMRVHPVIDWHYGKPLAAPFPLCWATEIWAVSNTSWGRRPADREGQGKRRREKHSRYRLWLTWDQFIRHLDIPYCPLYDQGYTSLGGTQDTHPNPQLKKQGESGASFRPAYELTEDDEERLGRDR